MGWAGELGRQLTFAALAEDRTQFPVHMVAHNHPGLQFQVIQHPLLISTHTRHTHPCGTIHTYMQARHSPMYTQNIS